jgi:hypothetical protein
MLSSKPRNVKRRIARLEARLKASGIRLKTLRRLESLSLALREWGLRAAIMLLES